ncbi:MAG: hypothetical protein ABIP94_05080, partial [Planctomycetota bacterium]
MSFRISITPLLALPALAAAMLPAQVETKPQLLVERELFLIGGESHSLCYSLDGKWLASGGDRGEVVVVDAVTGAVRTVIEVSDHWIGGLHFSPDGERLAVVGRSFTLWDMRSGLRLGELPASGATPVDWSGDGALIAMVRSNNEALLLAADDLTVVRTLTLPGPTAVDAIAIDGKGERVAVGKRSGETFVFDVATGKLVDTLQQPDWVHGLAWLDDGRLLRLGWEGTLRGFATEDLPLGATAFSLAAQRDGSRVVVRTAHDIVRLAPGVEAVHLAGSGSIALHPDGQQWVRAFAGRVEIYRGNDLLRTLPDAHRQHPSDAVLTGDGRYAVVDADVIDRGNPFMVMVMDGGPTHDGGRSVFEVATGARVANTGLPTEGTLVPMTQGVEVALLRYVTDPARVHTFELQFWEIALGNTKQARLVRSVPLVLEDRWFFSSRMGWLSREGGYFAYADQ